MIESAQRSRSNEGIKRFAMDNKIEQVGPRNELEPMLLVRIKPSWCSTWNFYLRYRLVIRYQGSNFRPKQIR